MESIEDLIIIGAGLSGIGMACHFARECPNKRFKIFEARSAMGGTWDLFRYPGIRSDSDMHTLGYSFKPWTQAEAIADGPSILAYIQETAREFNIEGHIRYDSGVVAMNWLADKSLWHITCADKDGKTSEHYARFVVSCAGYYHYDGGHKPDFAGSADFKGPIIHPQHWPEELDYSGKNVVVIGSGATAVTLVPVLAQKARAVTMLQRTPSYVTSWPAKDRIGNVLRKIMPEAWAYKLIRKKNIARTDYVNSLSRDRPEIVRRLLLRGVRKKLGRGYDIKTHFTPSYKPWDQRLCLVPDGDLFKAIKSGRAQVLTDHIERFTQDGITLKSGAHVPADIIVTATGLRIRMLGDVKISVEGARINPADSFTYKGMMLSGVPNFSNIFGYVNASWTLRADLISQHVCRLINHMEDAGHKSAVPRAPQDMEPRLWLDFEAGYIQRAASLMPKQGDRDPWQNIQNYKRDRAHIGKSPVDDGAIVFS